MLQTVILGLYTVLSPMIQALFQNRKAIRYFLYGVVVKLVLQIPFILVFRSYGPLLSTTIALMVPIVLMYREIQTITQFNRTIVFKRTVAWFYLDCGDATWSLDRRFDFGLDFPTKWPYIEHDLYHRHWRIRGLLSMEP